MKYSRFGAAISLMALFWIVMQLSGCGNREQPLAASETWTLEQLLSQQERDEAVTEVVEVRHL